MTAGGKVLVVKEEVAVWAWAIDLSRERCDTKADQMLEQKERTFFQRRSAMGKPLGAKPWGWSWVLRAWDSDGKRGTSDSDGDGLTWMEAGVPSEPVERRVIQGLPMFANAHGSPVPASEAERYYRTIPKGA